MKRMTLLLGVMLAVFLLPSALADQTYYHSSNYVGSPTNAFDGDLGTRAVFGYGSPQPDEQLVFFDNIGAWNNYQFNITGDCTIGSWNIYLWNGTDYEFRDNVPNAQCSGANSSSIVTIGPDTENYVNASGDVRIAIRWNANGAVNDGYINELEFYNKTNSTIYECDSCDGCNDVIINSAVDGDIVRLNQSIYNNDTCIHTYTGADGITFDCDGYTISGNWTGNGIRLGEYPNRTDYMTVENCIVKDFGTGIFLRDARYGVIRNVTAWNNTGDGINLYYAGTTEVGEYELYDFNTSYNGDNGLENALGSGTNALWSTYIHDGVSHDNLGDGFYHNGDGNIHENLIFYNNGEAGIHNYGGQSLTGHIQYYKNVTLYGNQDGFHCQRWCRSNYINDSRIYDNTRYGIFMDYDSPSYGAYNNRIYNTMFNNTVNFYSDGGGNNVNYWNTTYDCDNVTNILGGTCFGGNFWNDTSLWAKNDSLVAVGTNQLDAWNTDYHPLTYDVDEYPPEVNLTNPENTSYAVVQIDFNYTATDNQSGVDSCWYSLNGGSNTTFPSCENATVNVSDNDYHLEVWVNDSVGWLGYSDVWFNIDNVAPTITITSPTSVTYRSSPVSLAVTANEPVITWLYSLNNGSNNSFSPNASMTVTFIGSNEVEVWGADEAGNVGYSSATFGFNPTLFYSYPFFLIIPTVLALVAVSLLVSSIVGKELDLNKIITAGVLMIITIVMIGVMYVA